MRTNPPHPLTRTVRRPLLALTLAAGLFAAGVALRAEECPPFRPTPEHAVLTAWAGSYDLAFSDGSTGTSTCRTSLGGRWLLEEVQANLGGQVYEGRGATSYDPVRKRYVTVWIDSTSAVPLVSEGTYDPEAKTMTLVGDLATADGKRVKSTLVIAQTSATERTLTLRIPGADGEPITLFTITYRPRAS